MLQSKKLWLVITMIFVVNHVSYSQNQVQDSIYHRNEISVNASPVVAVLTSGKVPESALSIGYAHNFGRNHFLRAGIKIIPNIQRNQDNSLEDLLGTVAFNYWGPNGNTTVITDTVEADKYYLREMKASFYIGYEHLIGRKKTKFLFGMDLMVGLNSYYASRSTYTYAATHTPDTANNVYNSSFDYIGKNDEFVSTVGLHLGFTPRIGVRYDASKRVAFTIMYAPMFYFDMTPYQYTTPVGRPALILYAGTFMAEAGFIVKL